MVRSSASPRARHQHDAPGYPGSRGVQPAARPRARHDRRRQGQAAARRTPATMNYEIKFLYAQDDPMSVDVKDAIVKGLKEAASTRQPYATTIADSSRRCVPTRTRRSTSVPPDGARTGRPVLVVPAAVPVDQPRRMRASAPTTRCSPRRRSTTRSTRSSDRRSTSSPASGTSSTRTIARTYFPLFVDRLLRCRDDARVERSTTCQRRHRVGMPTWKDIWVGCSDRRRVGATVPYMP